MTSGLVNIEDVTEKPTTWNPRITPDLISYIDISSIDRAEKRIITARKIIGSEAPSRARQVVEQGDILISTVRPNLNAVAIVTPEFDGATASTGFSVLRPNSERLDSNYLYQFVKTALFVNQLMSRATGANYPAVSERVVRSSRMPLPDINEQRRIANILDKADEIRRKRQQAIQLADDFLKSLFLDIFGDPVTNPKKWSKKSLGKLAEKFSDGPFGSNLKSSHYVDAGIRIIRLQNIGVRKFVDQDKAFISEQHFETIKKHECRPGDVLIGTLGDPNLRACLQPEWLPIALNKADCVQMRVDPDQVTPEFIEALLNQEGALHLVSKFLHGQTRTRISSGTLKNLEVPVPPLYLQKRYSKLCEKHRLIEIKLRASVEKSSELFAAMQSSLFSQP